MNKAIVSTTINPPTEAIRKFDAMEDWHLIVAGDRKTPADYRLERGTYLSPADQESMDKNLSDAIGWNCIQRRNFAILAAYEAGADVIALVDDDNIPYDFWGKDLMLGREISVNYYETDLPAFDPVGPTTNYKLWHRGYPLELLADRDFWQSPRKITCQIQADFWNLEPDIDAICRMEHRPECMFDPGYFPIASNKMSPFNSQNTFLSREVIKDYFLAPFIGRQDDIWASYYVQAKGYQVVYGKPSVYQKRNEHNLIDDMKAEYLGYEHNLRLVKDLTVDPNRINHYLPLASIRAWELYRRHFV